MPLETPGPGNIELLVKASVASLALGDTDVLFVNGAGEVFTAPKTGGAAVPVGITTSSGSEVARDDTSYYVTNFAGAVPGAGSIVRYAR